MFEYQVLYWRDIPAQIKIYVGKRPKSHPLADRFQVWIDRVAMAEGLTGTDEYLDLWQWSDKIEREGEPDEALPALIAEIEAGGDQLIAAAKAQ
ncbi:MAG: hypothetical protein CME20_01875 [Gemmatimonadetes bacterium]|jgi:hypothetical protein|nr:hypothetical protein [Gemmatimonadota bacterium]